MTASDDEVIEQVRSLRRMQYNVLAVQGAILMGIGLVTVALGRILVGSVVVAYGLLFGTMVLAKADAATGGRTLTYRLWRRVPGWEEPLPARNDLQRREQQ